MDTKWKRSRAVCGFLAFAVGLSLILEGLLFFGANLSSRGGRQWLADSFQDDWRNTQEFRDFVSARLEKLITMGAGGNVYKSSFYGGSESSAKRLLEQWKQDKNVLYYVAASGGVKYTNDETLARATAETLADKYGFFLQFDGEKVRIWQDGEELDVYGGGWYDYDKGGQWCVPGYDNFTLDDDAAGVRVTMAVIDEPRVFIQGSYGEGSTEQYSELYYLKQNLEKCRRDAAGRTACLCVGLALMAGYVLLRRDKKRADQALARGTGRVWFEVKVVLLLLLLYVSIPRTTYLYDVWNELTASYSTVSVSSGRAITSIAVDGDIVAELEQQGLSWEEIEGALAQYSYPVQQTVSFGTAVSILSNNGGWLLREFLVELAGYRANLLILFWGLYLLLFNDWRYNRRPWRHGLLALLAAHELKYPIQKRLVRRAVLPLALCCLWLLCMVLFFWVFRDGIGRVAVWFALLLLSAALLLVLALSARRTRQIAWELGELASQLAAVRAGALEQELLLPEEHDLHQMADDLNHIQQGLHQAVEERTRSERMKVELVTNVSHDLKTPLTSIISYTELLAQEPLEPPASEYVKILGEKSQRLRAMVQDVFEVSKAASGQLPVKLERLDYARLLRQTLADMDGAIQDSGLALRASLPEEEVPITADSDRLYRVFQNLIGNALKYSLAGSRVYLTLEVREGRAAAKIRNTSAAELKPGTDYTARFVRGDESRTDGGSGLGLSIADSFTRACGGTMTVATEADLFSVSVEFPLDRPDIPREKPDSGPLH